MELCPQETQPKDENLETLEELSRELKQISDSYFEMQVKAAILNVEIGTLFDPEVASKLKGSEETCIKCSQRINELVEKPIDLSASEDVEMNEPLAN